MDSASAKIKPGLGRGLKALMSAPSHAQTSKESGVGLPIIAPGPVVVQSNILPLNQQVSHYAVAGIMEIQLAKIGPQAGQPRREFKETELAELASSIKRVGLLQPIVVRRLPEPTLAGIEYEIVAGERRFRASKMAGLVSIPAVVKTLGARETFELAIIENVQRADLNPIEEAHAFARLVDEYGLSQEQVAEKVGKERATVANVLRLLKLTGEVQQLLKEGKISNGHAKALLTVREPAVQVNLAKKVVEEGLSVRALEAIVSRSVTLPPKRERSAGEGTSNKPPFDITEIEGKIRQALGTKVSIQHKRDGQGKVVIEYFSPEELDRLVEKFSAAQLA